jgi:hypothetical protein
LYGYETLSLTLREEHRLRVFENRVLRRIFGPNREEVSGGRRRLHNEQPHNLHASPNTATVFEARRMRWVDQMLGMRNTYKILVGKPEGKRQLGDLGVDGKKMLGLILGK